MYGIKDGIVEKESFFTFNEDFSGADMKEKRAKIHLFFKDKVKLYETDTVVEGDKRILRLFLVSAMSNNSRKRLKLAPRT